MKKSTTMDDYCRRSGQIPAFGDWDYSNEMPITQYFECARQAGLIRYSSSSGESDPYIHGGGDLYTVDHSKDIKASRNYVTPLRKRGPQVKESKKKHQQQLQVKKKVYDYDVTEPPRKLPNYVAPPVPVSTQFNYNNNNNSKMKRRNDVVASRRPPKAVDEDLYKIPPHLLHSAKRKKMPGFFSCLVPSACAS